MLTTYAEVDLSETPCIVTPCGHIFTVESLDGVMSMSDYYDMDPATGLPAALRGDSKPFSYDEMKLCPDCRGPLRAMPRYGRIVRRALLDESTKKLVTWSNRKYIELAEQLQKDLDKLRDSREDVEFPKQSFTVGPPSLPPARALASIQGMSHRYSGIAGTHRRIARFLQQVASEEQPFMRVRNIVETVRRRRRLQDAQTGIAGFAFKDSDVLQTRGELMALSLALRCDITGLVDLVAVWNAVKDGTSQAGLQLELSTSREQCEQLARSAEETMNILQ